MLHLLLIDDNPDDRTLAIRQLRQEFVDLEVEEIATASGFAQALEAGNFDLAIVDYRLLWSNGIELLRALKARYQDCPVVMFTNTGSEEIAVEAMKLGLDDYVIKSPKHYIRLAIAVRSALERAENRRRATELEIRLQSLLNQLNVGIFRSTPEGQLLEANAALLHLFNISSLSEIQQINLPPLFLQAEAFSPSQSWEREVQLSRADGNQIWVLLSHRRVCRCFTGRLRLSVTSTRSGIYESPHCCYPKHGQPNPGFTVIQPSQQ